MKFKSFLVLALAAPLLGTLYFAPRPGARVALAQDAPVASFDEGHQVSLAREVAVPASVRRTLARRAHTLKFLTANAEGRAVWLHLWNPAKGDTVLDVWTKTSSRSKSKRASAMRRLKRLSLGRIESNRIAVRVAPLQSGKNTVIALNWPEEQSAGAFMTVPMLALIFPAGLEGAAIKQDLSTESSASGNVFYSLRTGAGGESFFLLTTEVFDGGVQQLQRFSWKGSRFVSEGEGISQPLSTD